MNDLLQGQELSRKASNRKLKDWGPEQQMAFHEFKEACYVAPVLAYSDYTQLYTQLHTDSSLDSLGAVLYKKDLGGQLRVIAYASRNDLSETSSTAISKESPKHPETNDDVQEGFLESFDI